MGDTLFEKERREQDEIYKNAGLGNDYVYVNGFEERIENPSEMAVKVSNRNFGVGSDGLILINSVRESRF